MLKPISLPLPSKPHVRGLVMALIVLFGAWPTGAQAAGHALHFYGMAARVSAQEVQNTTGNAFALQVGLAPRLRITRVPVGLKLLLEYGALRDTQHHVFSVPSAQLLLDGHVAQRLELAIGAGAQFWAGPAGPVTRPVVTLEAHYVPPIKVFGILRSGFVASSIGASSGAGLQVRAGLEFDFHRQPAAQPASDGHATPTTQVFAAQPCAPTLCQPCPAAEKIPSAPQVSTKVSQTLGQTMTFAFNVSSLDAPSKAYLATLAQALTAQNAQFDTLSIVGHASARGTNAQNLTVSVRRAHNVAQALMAAGVPQRKLTVHGVGESEPLTGFDVNDRAQQCVVLHLIGGSPQGPLHDLVTLPAAPHAAQTKKEQP